jgi:general secretion pathway protein G
MALPCDVGKAMSHNQPCIKSVRRNGFTLIELLVVLSIVAVLFTLVGPRYHSHVQASKEAVLKENLRQTRETLDQFFSDKGRYPQTLEELVEQRYLRKLPMDPLTESSQTWLIDPPSEGREGRVYNIRSGAQGVGQDGQAYAQW